LVSPRLLLPLFLWGTLLCCTLADARAQSLVAVEYFFDDDPGVGNANRVNLAEPDSLFTLDSLEVSVRGLLPGPHLIGFRTLSELGEWSLTQTTRFYLTAPAAPLPRPALAAGEYFIDEDPGEGNGIPFSLPGDTTSIRQTLEASNNGLAAGAHRLGIRLQDSQGNWGLTSYSRFFVQRPTVPFIPEQKKIAQVTYFLDTLPRPLGSGRALLPHTPGFAITVSDSIDLDTTDILPGRHHLKVRAQDEMGTWSLTYAQPFDFCFPEGITGGFALEQQLNEITITDQSTNAVEYIYDMGNGDSLFTEGVAYTYPQGGNYEVCQTVYSFCDTVTTCQSVFVPTPRVKDSIPDMTILEDAPPFALANDLEMVFEDPDGDPLSFVATSGNDSLLVEVRPDRSLWLSATENFFGESFVAVAATAGGVTAYDTVLVKVLSVNDLPQMTEPIYDQAYDEDTGPREVYRDVRRLFVDVEDDSLLFEVTSDNPNILPEIDSRRRFMIDMAEDFVGSGNVTISATDDSLGTTAHTINVLIVPIPDAPKVRDALPDTFVQEDPGKVTIAANLDTHFFDPEGDPISYEVGQAPEWLNVQIEEEALSFHPAADAFGSAEVVVLASDGELTGSDTLQITVSPVNDAPRFREQNRLFLCDGLLTLPIDSLLFDPEHSAAQLNIAWEILSSDPANANLVLRRSGNNLLFDGGTASFSISFSATDAEGLGTVQQLTLSNFVATVDQQITTLIGGEGDGYQWLKNGQPIDGATARQFVVTERGTYQVRITQGDCEATSEGITVTALEKMEGQLVSMYPNPVRDWLHLEAPQSSGQNFSVQILDLTGKVHQQVTLLADRQQSIDVRKLPQGVYLLKFSLEGKQFFGKFIKRE